MLEVQTMTKPRRPLGVNFGLGRVIVTEEARNALRFSNEQETIYLVRHKWMDHGDVTPETVFENEVALAQGRRILSLYTTAMGHRIVIVTEGDHSATTVMAPYEF